MKTYSLEFPPVTSGVYAIINKAEEKLYIGKSTCLRQRFLCWSATIALGSGTVGANVRAQLGDTRPEDWQFVVLMDLPELDEDELAPYEKRAIARAGLRYPGWMVNFHLLPPPSAAPPAELLPRAEGRPCKTVIVGPDGTAMSYDAVVAALGAVSKKGLYSRLNHYRRQGVSVVSFEELDRRTKLYTSAKARRVKRS